VEIVSRYAASHQQHAKTEPRFSEPTLGLPDFTLSYHSLTHTFFFFSPIHATYSSHSILLDFIILIILGEEYKNSTFDKDF
jgi:hypothetical protein